MASSVTAATSASATASTHLDGASNGARAAPAPVGADDDDAVRIDADVFHRRARRLFDLFEKKPELFSNARCLLVPVAVPGKQVLLGACLQLWMLGYEFTDTIFAFLPLGAEGNAPRIVILTSPKKAAFLENIVSAGLTLDRPVHVTILQRTKQVSNIEPFFEMINKSLSSSNRTIATLEVSGLEGKFGALFQQEFKKACDLYNFQTKDAAVAIGVCMGEKEKSELNNAEISALMAAEAMTKSLAHELSVAIDEEKKITHAALSAKIYKSLDAGSRVLRGFKAKLDPNQLDWAFPPAIQSGGNFNLTPGFMRPEGNLSAGVVIGSLGTRYKEYCATIVRTFLFDPSKQQEKNYSFLVDLRNKLIQKLEKRAKCSQIYKAARDMVASERPDLLDYLPASMGAPIGIEFNEECYSFTAENDRLLPLSCVVNLQVAFENISNPNSKRGRDATYTLCLADTLSVVASKHSDEVEVNVLTQSSPVAPGDVVFFIGGSGKQQREAEEQDEEVNVDDSDNFIESDDEDMRAKAKRSKDKRDAKSTRNSSSASDALDSNGGASRPRRAAAVASGLIDRDRRVGAEEQRASIEKRRENQRRLARLKHEEGLRMYPAGSTGTASAEKRQARKIEAYKNAASMPKETGNQIYVDTRSESIVLPMMGMSVPFHVSTLKNVSKSDEGEYVSLRLNFIVPGQMMMRKEDSMIEDPASTFVKTLTYRSRNAVRLNETFRQISELRKQALKAEAERKDRADIVEQECLIEAQTHLAGFHATAAARQAAAAAQMHEVFARPTLDGKRSPGDLQIHVNGLRYVSRMKSENRIDILFANIQNLIFQPCDKEQVVILHVHLVNPIMIGKKKTKDVQFYKEAMDATFDETGVRRRRVPYGDEEEVEQEQRERRMRMQLNKEFHEFGKRIVDANTTSRRFELDVPFRELGFYGVPLRSSVLVQPTTECLVHLTETPFFVIQLSDIYLVHFERVYFGLKNFDMVIVFKDFSRPPARVNTIAAYDLEPLKDFFNSVDILFSEGEMTLNWTEIMKTINREPAEFFALGGWGNISRDLNGVVTKRAGKTGEDGEDAEESECEESQVENDDDDDGSAASSSDSEVSINSENWESSGSEDSVSSSDGDGEYDEDEDDDGDEEYDEDDDDYED